MNTARIASSEPAATLTAASWPIQEAKARFSELLKASMTQGPQVVTYHGKEAAVVIPIAEWERLKKLEPLDMKTWLRARSPQFEDGLPLPLPLRGRASSRLRPAPTFDD